MQIITRDALARELDAPNHPIVVEVLAPTKYSELHLPSAINVPLGPDYEKQIQRAVPDKHSRVVVYCQDRNCTASGTAAETMERLGYDHVSRYEAGKSDWQGAGLPVEH